MKNVFTVILLILLCFMLSLNVFAASEYVITDKKILQNFETGDPVSGNTGGNTGWGSHWIETALSAVEGLEGKVALRLDFGESDVGTIGGVHADNIGTTNDEDDWTAGQALLYRIKNLSDSTINLATTIDVTDTNSATRTRLWADGTQILLDTSFAPVDAVYTDALSKDGVTTTSGRELYVVIPAGFDGYVLWDLSQYVNDVEQEYESIIANTTADPNWRATVKHLVPLFQDCQNKSVILDDFRLVDYELVDIIEEAAPEESAPAADTQQSTAAPAQVPQTSNNGVSVFLLCVIAAAAFTFKKILNVRANF